MFRLKAFDTLDANFAMVSHQKIRKIANARIFCIFTMQAHDLIPKTPEAI